MKKLHVAAAQVHSGNGIAETLGRIERQVKCAAIAGAEVILFSEEVIQGADYDRAPRVVKLLAETAEGESCRAVSRMAVENNITVLTGFCEKDRGKFYNSVLIARPDGTTAVQRKHIMATADLEAGLSSGPEPRNIFEINGVRMAIITCADVGIKNLAKKFKEQQVRLVFLPTGGGGRVKDMLHEADLKIPRVRSDYAERRKSVFVRKAVMKPKDRWGCAFVAANALGRIGKRTCHQGHCLIIDGHGIVRAQIPGTTVLEHQQDQMIHAELNFR